MEALKAQAVCARTYILKCSKSKYKKYNAIADDSTSYQVYNRIGENNKTKKAHAYHKLNGICLMQGRNRINFVRYG